MSFRMAAASAFAGAAAWLKAAQWPLALIVASSLLALAAPLWDVPLSRDQGVYATCADTLLRGGVPFKDCWDTKGPALHYTYALAQILFGRATSGPYVLNALAIAATALAIAALTHEWIADRHLGYAAGLLYGALAISVRFDMNAQPESFANLFAMLGLVALTIGLRAPRRSWLIGAGALLAVTVAYKYALALPYGAAALGLILFAPSGVRPRPASLGLVLAGALGLMLLFALYLLVVGALGDGLTHLRFILFYFPRAQLNPDEYALRSRPVLQTLQYFARLPAVFGAAFIGIGLSIGRRRWYGSALALAALAGIAVVWGQQRFTPYHWTAMLPTLSLGAAALAHEVRQMAAGRRILLAGLVTALTANAARFWYVDQWQILGAYRLGRESREAFFERQGVWDHAVAADYIRERTRPTDSIWVWGHHTAIYYLAERQSASRFIYNEPLLMHIRGGNPWQAAWRAEALEALVHDPPIYILLTTFDRTFFDFQNPNDSWRDIPDYSAFTRHHYLKEYEFGRFQFYRLIPYWSRHNELRLLDAVTVSDLVAELPQAVVEAPSDPPVEVLIYTLPSEAGYPAIRLAPEGRLIYTLDLPPAPVCLRLDVAMYPDSWAWGGDGAAFIVEAAIDDQREVLLDTYISNATEDRHWHAHLIDLSPYGGRTLQLILRTGPGPAGDFTGDWAGWGMPRIVRPPAGDRCDTNAIVGAQP